MKTLYFDCSSGISGNMVLGALTEIIGDEQYLIEELKKLNADGYKIEISKKVKNGITGTYVDVIVDGKDKYGHEHHIHEHHHEHEHEHAHEDEHEYEHKDEHHHHHEHRNLNDINKIISESTLDEKTKELANKNDIPLKELYKIDE